MIGVVLWSDMEDGKAVFWCEDQGDLAYFDCADATSTGFEHFDAGDMVQFDVTVDGRLRRASNARLVLEQAYVGLPDTLRENATGAAPHTRQSNVVRMPHRCGVRTKPVKEKIKA